MKNCKVKPPLNVRESFFGGRTSAIKLYHEINNDLNEKIHYFDVISLYPYVVKTKSFPVGHPVIIKNPDSLDINAYNGFIFLKILPPKNLFFPVLPVRLNNKLVFPLCYECARIQNNKNCKHDENIRSIVGTYTTMEVKVAVEKNYKILEIYEIYNFLQFLPASETNEGIFTKFINDFIKVKIQASGWPKENMNEIEKKEYIDEYSKNEGIDLNINEIQNNPGLRSIGKLIVNSFWGKFGQNPNLTKTEYISEPQKFFKLLSDPTVIVNDAILISDEMIQVEYEKECLFVDNTKHSSQFIASFTSSYARLELYKILEKLNERVLYMDTDSVIFTAKTGDYIPPIGKFIGQLSNELVSEGEGDAYITRFVSCGSKNYAYEVFKPHSNSKEIFIKVKGISLNFSAKNIVKFETMKNLIDEYVQSIEEPDFNQTVYEVPQQVFKINPFLDITSEKIFKKYRFFYDKRRIILFTYETLPFGYNNLNDT